MASIFTGNFEKDEYGKILERRTFWYRKGDDVTVIVPENTDVVNKQLRVNNVDKDIQFTMEEVEGRKSSFFEDCDVTKWHTC